MIQLKTTSMLGAQDPRDGSLAAIGKKFADNFHNALSGALSATLDHSGVDPNSATLPIAPAVSTETAATPFSIASAASNPGVTATTATAIGASGDHTQSVDDAYWAKQPPAVQALRNMGDYDQRMQLASKLTAQGYNIDVPIMVWGWDPGKIMAARQGYGYTWVPSAMQPAITEAPGLGSPGIQAYDPKHQPDNSITV